MPYGFGFAGLWDTWKSPTGDINSCTIITTTPNDLMAEIHDRMPVILSRNSERVWLDQSIVDVSFLKSLLVSYSAELMVAYEVSGIVNSVKNNGPECMDPVGLDYFKVLYGLNCDRKRQLLNSKLILKGKRGYKVC